MLDPEPFEAWRGWRFGLAQEQFAPDLITFEIPETDDQGATTLSLDPAAARPTPRARCAPRSPSRSASRAGAKAARASPCRCARAAHFVAMRPAFEDDAIDAGSEAAFDIAAVSPEGAAVPATLRLRLVRERPNWRIVVRGSIAR